MIENERTKLIANALDRASTACLAVGVLAPLGAVIQIEGPTFTPNLPFSFAGWLVARSCYI